MARMWVRREKARASYEKEVILLDSRSLNRFTHS